MQYRGSIENFYITKGINDLCQDNPDFNTLVLEKIDEFMSCNWGNIPDDDKALNNNALITGERIIGSYLINDTKIWIIADPENEKGIRKAITVLLPEEY